MADTPVIIADAWFFDWNMDGKEDVLVNASNMIWHYGDRRQIMATNPPNSDNTVKYEMSALFISENDPVSWNNSYCVPIVFYVGKPFGFFSYPVVIVFFQLFVCFGIFLEVINRFPRACARARVYFI